MRNNGITLIALVITIILLLILAGMVLNLTLGENGILNKTQYAKEKYELEQVREKVEIGILDTEAQYLENKLEIEVILQDLLNNKIFDTINKEENIGNIGKYEVKLKYDENGKVSIEYIQEMKSNNITYLYNAGKECIDITGGWKTNIILSNPQFTLVDNYLYIDASSVDSVGYRSAGYYYMKNENLDFSQFSKLHIKWSREKCSAESHFTIVAGEYNIENGAPGEWCDDNHFCYTFRNYLNNDLNNEVTEELEFDIENLTSSGNLYLYVYSGKIKIHELYLYKK